MILSTTLLKCLAALLSEVEAWVTGRRGKGRFQTMTDPWWILFAPLMAAIIGFSALWPLSVKWRDVSIVDCLWAPGFFAQLLLVLFLLPTIGLHGWVVFALITVWSARLTWVLLRRRIREGIEDPRYDAIRTSWGASFWWKSLFIVFVLQAIVQWLIVLGPIAVLTAEDGSLGWFCLIGLFAAFAGLALETMADHELDRFKETAKHGDLCTTGLRAYIRHPNYLGEIVFWCGIASIGLDAGAWWALISPLLIILFLTKISGAPLVEERLQATRPAYSTYRARVPGFIPRLTMNAGQ